MTNDDVKALLAEQVGYYRARSPEYDAPTPVDDGSRRQLVDALDAFAPRGRVLEFACGTGQWTLALAQHASQLTLIDASPEMLAIASARVPDAHVRFITSDSFAWEAEHRYDVVFFSAWLSHVPPQRFDRFWALVGECLSETGRVLSIDELPGVAAHEQTIPGAVTPAVKRPLSNGRRYRTVKVFYEPDALHQRLARLGWRFAISPVSWRLFYATGQRDTPL